MFLMSTIPNFVSHARKSLPQWLGDGLLELHFSFQGDFFTGINVLPAPPPAPYGHASPS